MNESEHLTIEELQERLAAGRTVRLMGGSHPQVIRVEPPSQPGGSHRVVFIGPVTGMELGMPIRDNLTVAVVREGQPEG